MQCCYLTKKNAECAKPWPIPWLRASSWWSNSVSCGNAILSDSKLSAATIFLFDPRKTNKKSGA